MATNFPASLDTSVTLPAEGAVIPLSTNHVTAHQNLQDALEAVEAKVGVDSSAVTSTHDYKLSEVTTTDKAVGKTATQTLTNKTLTSPVINVGTDATGDIYYRNAGVLTRLPVAANGTILKLAAGVPSWAAETTTVDASATVKGIVEIATAAEITAGTATGGTAAVLAVSPDQLALSTPVFNGSGLTNIPRKVNVTTANTTVTGTAVDTAFYTVSIPANTLSTNNGLFGRVYLSWNSVTTTNKVISLKYGATTVATWTATPSAATNITVAGYLDFTLLANAATNAQEGSFLINLYGGQQWLPASLSTSVASGFAQGTSAEDSTGALNLVLSVTHAATDSLSIFHGFTQSIK